MTAPSANPTARARAGAAAVLAAALAGGAVSFAAGRLSAPDGGAGGPAPSARAQDARDVGDRRGAVVPPGPSAPAPAGAHPASPAQPPAAAAHRPVSFAPSVEREVVVRATEDARAQLESLRPALVARCWPEGGLGNGRSRASVTFHVSFDREGREIARGIGEDRRSPAGPFARCLRTLPLGSLAVAPPGTPVGVKVALSFP